MSDPSRHAHAFSSTGTGAIPTMVDSTADASDIPAGSTSLPPDLQRLRPLARRLAGRSGADVERIVREARQVARRAGRFLTWLDLERQMIDADGPRPEALRWRMAMHEAGHVLACLLLGGTSIRMISIDAPDGGLVERRVTPYSLQNAAWVMDQIVILLAGRSAEEIVFGETLAGSGGEEGSDLAMATRLAVAMETEFGFSQHQPLVHRTIADIGHLLTIDRELAAHVDRRLEQAHADAIVLLGMQGMTLNWLARILLQHGVLEGAELDRVLAEARTRLEPVELGTGRMVGAQRAQREEGWS